MSILPDQTMIDVASRIIDLLGDIMRFERYAQGVWEESVPTITVYLQPQGSSYRRSFRGIEDSIDFTGFTSVFADIHRGDRTIISDIYYTVDALENRGTHLEFYLRQTDEVSDT